MDKSSAKQIKVAGGRPDQRPDQRAPAKCIRVVQSRSKLQESALISEVNKSTGKMDQSSAKQESALISKVDKSTGKMDKSSAKQIKVTGERPDQQSG